MIDSNGLAEDSITLNFSDDNHDFNGSYNIPPTGTGVIIYLKSDSTAKPEYVAEVLRFGVLPEWAKPQDSLPVRKGSGQGHSYSREIQAHQAKLFNCRKETLAQSKSVWTQPRAHKRCVVPITGYFEWLTSKSGDKTPYYVHSEEQVLFLAGLYSHNTNYNNTDFVSDLMKFISSFSIVTGPAGGEGKNNLKWLHSRKPIFLKPFSKEWDAWLETLEGWDDSLLQCLDTDTNPVYDDLKWHIVDSSVGNPKNHGADAIKEVKVKQLSITLFFSPKKRTINEVSESKPQDKKTEIIKKEEASQKNAKSKPENSLDVTIPPSKKVKQEYQGSEMYLDANEEDDPDTDDE